MKEHLSPTERLGMLDEHGSRQFIIPAEVKGRFHLARKQLHAVLIILFLALPWLSIHGKQLLLFNIPERKFLFFGIQLFAHDAPLAFFLIMIFVVGLALVTALFGRVWCGWACPQTVFIDSMYREIEKWVEGDYIKRRQLRQQAWTVNKLSKVSLKWFLYLIVSSLIAHSFIAYFTGSRELIAMIQGPPSGHFSYFVMVSLMTSALLFNFGWFREQFCVIVCPYGKFQAALMDKQSVTIMYDEERGEPRKGSVPQGEKQNTKQGDCVSCNRCVQVCPTKIDIRNGIQLECIACTACADACDEIMAKVNKPKGLIRYKAMTSQPVHWFRPRILVYMAIVLICFAGVSVLLAKSEPFRIEILRAKNNPFVMRTEGSQQLAENQFILRLENHFSEPLHLKVESSEKNIKIVIPENPITISANEKRDLPMFVSIDSKDLKGGRYEFKISIFEDPSGKLVSEKNLTLIGPMP